MSTLKVKHVRWFLPHPILDRRNLRRCTLCQTRVDRGLSVQRSFVDYRWEMLFCDGCAEDFVDAVERLLKGGEKDDGGTRVGSRS